MGLAAEDEGLAAEDEGLAAEDEGLAAEDEGLASIFFVAKFDKNLTIFTINFL